MTLRISALHRQGLDDAALAGGGQDVGNVGRFPTAARIGPADGQLALSDEIAVRGLSRRMTDAP
jgi:hypothetical protein